MIVKDREVSASTPLPVQDVTSATKKTSITGEAITFSDGVAGTSVYLVFTTGTAAEWFYVLGTKAV
jgi:hypothetical protein